MAWYIWMIVAVAGALALFLAVIIGRAAAVRRKGVPLGPEKEWFSEDQQVAYARRLAEMIRCRTVSNKGTFEEHAQAFQELNRTVERLFPTLHARAEKIITGKDGWLYKIEGRDPSRNILLMSHHDVVEAEGEWEHDPFGGELIDGKIWGRGTVDTKTSLFGEMTALEELLREGREFPCNVWLGSSYNEEIAGDGIPLALQYCKEHQIRFELVLDEGGAIVEPPVPGVSCMCAMLAVHEKGRHVLECEARDAAAHAGLAAREETPIVRLAKFITEVDRKKPFITRLYPCVQGTFEGLAPYMSFPFRVIFANTRLFWPILKKLMPAVSPQAGSMLGTQCFFNKIQGEGGNTASASVTASLRCIDDRDLALDIAQIRKIAQRYGVEVRDGEGCEYHGPADISRPAYQYVVDCVHAVFPDVAAAPYLLPAGTDARHMVDVCPCVIRFAPIRINNAQFKTVHSENENIDIRAVADTVRFYRYLLEHYR